MDPFGVVAISACAAISLEYLVLRCGLHGSFASERWPMASEEHIREIVRLAGIVLDAYETDNGRSKDVTAIADGDGDDYDGAPKNASNIEIGLGNNPHAYAVQLQRGQEREQHQSPRQQQAQRLEQPHSKNLLIADGEGNGGFDKITSPRHGGTQDRAPMMELPEGLGNGLHTYTDHIALEHQGNPNASQELRSASHEIRPLQVDAADSGNGSSVNSGTSEQVAVEGVREQHLCDLAAGSPNTREPCTIRVLKRVSATDTGYLIPPYIIVYDEAANDVCLAVRGMHLYNEHDYLTLLDNRAGRQGLQVRHLHCHSVPAPWPLSIGSTASGRQPK